MALFNTRTVFKGLLCAVLVIFAVPAEQSSAAPSRVRAQLNPKAVITASALTGEAPLSLTFDARRSKPSKISRRSIRQYYWSFGNGRTSRRQRVRTTYTDAGTYTVLLRIKDSSGRSSRSSAIVTVTAPGINEAPTVNAGTDRVGYSGSSVALAGSVSDDGLPSSSSLSIQWSKVSGPGSVSFSNENSASTSSTFSADGVYILRLTASDGELSSSDEVSVTISAITECNDGVDNDGDGLLDWQYDLGCHGPSDITESAQSRNQENGWTTSNKAADTRVIYVSSSVGNDSWTGLCPDAPTSGACGPKRTIHQGYLLLRNGYADWLLLRRGDTWREEYLTRHPQYGSVWKGDELSGRSATEPVVIASYGESASRPILEMSMAQHLWGVQNVRLQDLEIYSYKKDITRPEFNAASGSELRLLYDNNNILIENCRLRQTSIVFQSVDDANGQHRFDNLELRRSIIENTYSIGSHMQGIYTSSGHAAHLLIEDNVFDHNGWSEDFRTALTAPNSNLSQWQSVTDGRIAVELNQQTYNLSGLNFSGAASLQAVATVIQNALNAQTNLAGVTEIRWSALGNTISLQAASLPSTAHYRFKAYSGSAPGTDLHTAQWLNTTAQGQPEATIFNRNMYLSSGYGSTIVRGNIDANGASGGVQLRMGGTVTGNLFLKNPLGLTFGHAENAANSFVEGTISRNVLLGARDISDAPRGFGIALGSVASVSGGGGSSLIRNVVVDDNIVAHNQLGTANILAINLDGTGISSNVQITNNIVYNWARNPWPNPNDNRSCGINTSLAAGSNSIQISGNIIEQPNKGYVACSNAASTIATRTGNTYFSASPDSGSLWSSGWFSIGSSVSSASWMSSMAETNAVLAQAGFPDPNRSVESYMASKGLTATYEAFMARVKNQSRLGYDQDFTAERVNAYIRDGFGLSN